MVSLAAGGERKERSRNRRKRRRVFFFCFVSRSRVGKRRRVQRRWTHRDRLNIGPSKERAAGDEERDREREREEKTKKRSGAVIENSLRFIVSVFFPRLPYRDRLSKKMMNEEELTDYEAERAARIAANRARLGEACLFEEREGQNAARKERERGGGEERDGSERERCFSFFDFDFRRHEES